MPRAGRVALPGPPPLDAGGGEADNMYMTLLTLNNSCGENGNGNGTNMGMRLTWE